MAGQVKYTFSHVMSSLVELESKLTEFYREAAKRTHQNELRDTFSSFSEKSSTRRDALERVRRESVVEMALEPITDLDLQTRSRQIDTVLRDGGMSDLQKAIALESVVQDVYSETSTKVIYTSADASILLDRLSQESLKRRNSLSTMQR